MTAIGIPAGALQKLPQVAVRVLNVECFSTHRVLRNSCQPGGFILLAKTMTGLNILTLDLCDEDAKISDLNAMLCLYRFKRSRTNNFNSTSSLEIHDHACALGNG